MPIPLRLIVLCVFLARAEYNGVKLVSERLEVNKKAADSIIMAKRHSPNEGDPKIDVGRIQAFIHNIIPGTEEEEAWIVSAAWFDHPRRQEERMNVEINCPVVMNAKKDYPSGNYWPLTEIAPTKLILAPYITCRNGNWCVKDDRWQVLHTASDFITRF